MANETLNAVTALEDYQCVLDGFSLTEMPDKSLLSIGFSPSKLSQVATILTATLALEMPLTGARTIAEYKKGSNVDIIQRTLMGLQRDQLWLLSMSDDDKVSLRNLARADAPFWMTDQSDAWVLLDIAGARCTEVLERLCPLDLNQECFTVTSVARTIFEHISVVIVRHSATRFYLLTPRSSVRSFVHALSHAATHVINESAVRFPLT